MDLREMHCDDENWIELALDSVQWQIFVRRVP
jgi:hypothetical protein